MQQERRRFGALEVIFILMAAGYLGYVMWRDDRPPAPEVAVTREAVEEVAIASTPSTLHSELPRQVLDAAQAKDRLAYLELYPPEVTTEAGGALLERANLYQQVADHSAAIADYNTLIAQYPNRAALYIARAESYIALAQYERAERDLVLAEEFTASNADLWRLRGDIALAQNDPEAALAAYTQGITLAPSIKGYLARGIFYLDEETDITRATEDLLVASRLGGGDALVFYHLGRAYEEAQNVDAAIRIYTSAIQRDRTLEDAFFRRGMLYFDANNPTRALQDLNQAVRLDPQDSINLNNRGFAYAAIEDFARAVLDYDSALQLAPDDAITLGNRAYAYYRLNEYALAMADFNRAIELDDSSPALYNNRGLVHEQLDDLPAAIADYTQALTLPAPDDQTALFYYNRGRVYLALEDDESRAQAIADLARASVLNDAYAETWRWLGDAYSDDDNTLAALSAYERYLDAARKQNITPLGYVSDYVAQYQPLIQAGIPTDDSTLYTRAAVTLYATPSTSATPILQLDAGEAVRVESIQSASWALVAYQERYGWVPLSLLRHEYAAATLTAETALRQLPDESTPTLKAPLPVGTAVNVSGRDTANRWYWVQTDAHGDGWLPQTAVRLEDSSAPIILLAP